MSVASWINKNTISLKGKCVAVSGSTGGIGTQLCRYLAYLGADIVLCDRNAEKSRVLGESLKNEFKSLNVDYVRCDLSDMQSVKTACAELLQKNIDFLILNAGAYAIPRKITDAGLDNVFQINFAAPYYLAKTLGEHIEKRGGRIVAVSSIAKDYSKIREFDVDFSGEKRANLAYGNAKRFLTYSLMHLFEDTSVLSLVHPGITFTNITNHYPKFIFAIIKHPMKVIFQSPKIASLSVLKGLFESTDKNEWIGPRVFNIWGYPKKQKLKPLKNGEDEKIFEIAKSVFNKIK